MKRSFMSTLCLALALALAQTAFAETLKKPELDKLVAARQASPRRISARSWRTAAKAEPMLSQLSRPTRRRRRWPATTWSISAGCSACTTACATRRR